MNDVHNNKGGKREGAATRRSRRVANEAIKLGISPLEYMLQVMRDGKTTEKRRDQMAKDAAPYVHPRLQAIDAKVGGQLVVKVVKFSEEDGG